MTLEDLDQIDTLRARATKGPWASVPNQYHGGAVTSNPGPDIAWLGVCFSTSRERTRGLKQTQDAAAYLAALSPEVVGELVRLARETLDGRTSKRGRDGE